MAIREILQLGNPDLYKICEPVTHEEVESLKKAFTDLQDTMRGYRKRYGAGRAIAAPQIGVFKRVIYMEVDEPAIIINPVLTDFSEEMIELWDDCMSFPDLLVRVKRHRSCRITYRDQQWQEHSQELSDDFSELLQHEADHLDGILAVSRAINEKSFALSSQRAHL